MKFWTVYTISSGANAYAGFIPNMVLQKKKKGKKEKKLNLLFFYLFLHDLPLVSDPNLRDTFFLLIKEKSEVLFFCVIKKKIPKMHCSKTFQTVSVKERTLT